MQSVYQQFTYFFITVGIGFLIAIIFDIYRVIRRLWRPRRIGTLVGDLLFWLLITLLAFTLLLMGNWGEVRLYVFLGIVLGFMVYVRYLSSNGQRIIHKLFLTIYKVLRFLWTVISWPFKMLLKILLVPLGFLLTGMVYVIRTVKKIGSRTKTQLKKQLKKAKDIISKQPKDKL